MTLVLAIETSNPTGAGAGGPAHMIEGDSSAGVAAVEWGRAGAASRVLGVETVGSGGGDDLTPAIDRLFRRLELGPAQIEHVAVSAGPGGFTSVRIAVMTAKMIALATGARCYAVPTARALARRIGPHAAHLGRLTVALAWKRRDAWVARFRRATGAAEWTEMNEGGVESIASIGSGAAGGALVAEPRLIEMLRAGGTLSASTLVIPPAYDPVAVAEAAAGLAPVSPDDLLPLYPREPEAVTRWRELRGEE